VIVKALETVFVEGSRRKKGEVFEYSGKLGPALEVVEGDAAPTVEIEAEKKEGPTKKELQSQLDAAGIKYGRNDNKETLTSLLNEAKAKFAPAASQVPDKSHV
jgi:hypothetical protein